MNATDKLRAGKLIREMRESYFSAIRAFERQRRYGAQGHTTKALEQQDKGMAFIRKAEAAEAKLNLIINA